MRVTSAGMVALTVSLIVTATASAELRTGSAPNSYPEPELSSPTRPELKRAAVRYDDVAGILSVTLTLYDGLADPASTSALRPWRAIVSVGDYLNGICAGSRDTWLDFTGALAYPEPGVVDSSFDFGDHWPDLPAPKAFNAERTEVTFTASDRRLVGLGTICADARIFDSRPSRDDSSQTFAFLLDGFDAADGALAREVRDYLRAEAQFVATRLRPRIGSVRLRVSCRRLYQTEFSCRAFGRIRRARGRPVLRLKGRMRFDAHGARKLGGDIQNGWRASMDATVNWRRCPADAPRSLRGRRCHIKTRWRGTDELAVALGL